MLYADIRAVTHAAVGRIANIAIFWLYFGCLRIALGHFLSAGKATSVFHLARGSFAAGSHIARSNRTPSLAAGHLLNCHAFYRLHTIAALSSRLVYFFAKLHPGNT